MRLGVEQINLYRQLKCGQQSHLTASDHNDKLHEQTHRKYLGGLLDHKQQMV